MPYKEKEIEKLYYSISEVATMFDVNTSLIRFWEKEFNILKPKKNKKGNRLFTKEDIENLKLIYNLVKEKGYTLQGAKDKLKGGVEKEEKQDSKVTGEVVTKLKEIRDNLLELQSMIDKPEPSFSPAPAASLKNQIQKAPEKKEDNTPPNDISPNQISLFD